MTFWEHFLRLLVRRPLPAVAALYWHLTRRKVRARNRLRVASADLQFAYCAWLRKERSIDTAHQTRAITDGWDWHPHFSILLHSQESCSPEQLERSLRSFERQTYSSWSVVDTDFNDIESWIARAAGDFILPLRIGDELSSTCLFRLAEAARAKRDSALFYGDEDQLDERGRRIRPWFKPRWNEEMFLALDYVSSCVAIETGVAREANACANGKDVGALVLAAAAAAEGRIVHVPRILCHVDPHRESLDRRLDTLSRHLKPFGASCAPGLFGTVKVQWPLPEELPLVSIIIPTKDKVELLEACVHSVLARTTYESFEILIVDNASVERKTAEYLSGIGRHPKVRVLDYPHPYNFSTLNNLAAQQAHGSYLCLLNNDTEVLEPDWLTEMMRYAIRENIGAVGAKLLYPDGSIQHAGVVVGIGEAAGHAHRLLPATDPGYFRMPHVAQYVSAVTAACLVVEKKKFQKIDGFDPELAVAFNDVDLCLRLQSVGWRNVYVPHAVLVHHESKTRGKDIARNNIARFSRELETLQRRWGTKTYVDPVHNPNLDRYSETFVIGL